MYIFLTNFAIVSHARDTLSFRVMSQYIRLYDMHLKLNVHLSGEFFQFFHIHSHTISGVMSQNIRLYGKPQNSMYIFLTNFAIMSHAIYLRYLRESCHNTLGCMGMRLELNVYLSYESGDGFSGVWVYRRGAGDRCECVIYMCVCVCVFVCVCVCVWIYERGWGQM